MGFSPSILDASGDGLKPILHDASGYDGFVSSRPARKNDVTQAMIPAAETAAPIVIQIHIRPESSRAKIQIGVCRSAGSPLAASFQTSKTSLGVNLSISSSWLWRSARSG